MEESGNREEETENLWFETFASRSCWICNHPLDSQIYVSQRDSCKFSLYISDVKAAVATQHFKSENTSVCMPDWWTGPIEAFVVPRNDLDDLDDVIMWFDGFPRHSECSPMGFCKIIGLIPSHRSIPPVSGLLTLGLKFFSKYWARHPSKAKKWLGTSIRSIHLNMKKGLRQSGRES